MKRETYKKLIELANEELKTVCEHDALVEKEKQVRTYYTRYNHLKDYSPDAERSKHMRLLIDHCHETEDKMRTLVEKEIELL